MNKSKIRIFQNLYSKFDKQKKPYSWWVYKNCDSLEIQINNIPKKLRHVYYE